MNIHHTKGHRLAALLCVVGFSTSAHAGSSLTTPALRWGDLDNAYVSCNVLNIGKRSATDVSIEIFNANAEVEASRVIPELLLARSRGRAFLTPSRVDCTTASSPEKACRIALRGSRCATETLVLSHQRFA